MDHQPTLSFVDENMLLVDGKRLQTTLVSANRNNLRLLPGDLQAILTIGDHAIRTQIESVYDTVRSRNPGSTVHRPSLWTMQLLAARHAEETALTERGTMNGGVITHPLEVRPNYREYWHAVEQAGFVPEIRRAGGGRTALATAGLWLMTRVDPSP